VPGGIGEHAVATRAAVSALLPGRCLRWIMADDASEATAELRLSRVKALSDRDHVALVTYLLARYPDTFPKMLDDALSAIAAGDSA
jgi:hypothetical protein